MKKLTAFIVVFSLFATMLCSMVLPTAHAGFTGKTILDSKSFNGALSTGEFTFDTTQDVTVNDLNYIVFGSNDNITLKKAKLMPRAKINAGDKSVENFLDMTVDLDIKQIPNDGVFRIAFGIQKNNGEFGENGNLELHFLNGQTLKIVRYIDSGISELASIQISNEQPSLVLDFDRIIGTENAKLTLSDGNAQVFTQSIGTTPIGFMAFGYTGNKCKVDITYINARTYSYERVENPGTITENFDNNEYNANLWDSSCSVGPFTPSYTHVENETLIVKDCKIPHFTSKYKYSNLELTFQIVNFADYRVDESGNVLDYASDTLSICFGVTKSNEDPVVSMTGDRAVIGIGGWNEDRCDMKRTSKRVAVSYPDSTLYEEYQLNGNVNPMNSELTAGRRTDVKIIYKDMQITLYMKYAQDGEESVVDSNWGEAIFSVKTSKQDMGCIRFTCYGAENISSAGIDYTKAPDFSIDSITIKNLDEQPLVCAMPEFRSNIYSLGEEVEYTSSAIDSDLLANRLNATENGCNGNIRGNGLLIVPIIVALAIIITVKVLIRRKVQNEKK